MFPYYLSPPWVGRLECWVERPDGIKPHQMTEPFMETLVTTRVEGVDFRYPGWELEIGNSKGFRLRGQSWFKLNVINNTKTVLGNPEEELKKVLDEDQKLPNDQRRWSHPVFDLSAEKFASNQLYAAFRREPLIFPRAIQSLILCAAAAEKISPTVSFNDVLEKMSLEPAFSYIYGFTPSTIENIDAAYPGFLDRLAVVTSQPSRKIFSNMADGELATYKLAMWVREAIMNEPRLNVTLGDIMIRPKSGDKGQKYSSKPCGENFEVDFEDVAEKVKEENDIKILIECG